MSIWTISMQHLAEIHSKDVELFDGDPWLSSRAPTFDYIIDSVEGLYVGTIVHHTEQNPFADKPHVWTDTSKGRTYCEYRGEVVSVETDCISLHRYCWNDYEDMRAGTRTACIQ